MSIIKLIGRSGRLVQTAIVLAVLTLLLIIALVPNAGNNIISVVAFFSGLLAGNVPKTQK